MATWDDVIGVATSLPEVEEGTSWGNRCWKVKGRTFVWVRPLGKKDRADLGDAAPTGEIAGVRVADRADKQAVLDTYDAVFTIPHFDNYDAVLIHLDAAEPAVVEELVVDAWLCMAPPKLAAQYAADHDLG
ncbi:MAG TPA: MmcQ/YjbR family DNA-binding protein [Ilumatobacter sp.]|nr:MmcQ/YjbR family DNA-binding protein [Ilumatobacter sp.]